MDLFQASIIKTVDLHTSGEPTRIIISGFPDLKGETLLDKRRYASENPDVDRVRKWLMLEPRGHQGMYGAILVKETELTRTGEADIGVLFCHNEGYSTMCGHATIALGRFLIDTHDLDIFPQRPFLLEQLTNDNDNDNDNDKTLIRVTTLRIHAPCGVVTVTVPLPIISTTPGDSNSNSNSTSTSESNMTRIPNATYLKPIRFKSIQCFVPSSRGGITISYDNDNDDNFNTNIDNTNTNINIKVDIAYGGAFYALVSSSELGFDPSSLNPSNSLGELEEAASILRDLLNQSPEAKKAFTHPSEPDLGFLYGITIIDSDSDSGFKSDQNPVENSKTISWICFFGTDSHSHSHSHSGSQIDRSPTGSCVSAHVPLSIERNKLQMGEWCTYESFLTKRYPGNGFRGRAVERIENDGRYYYIVEVEGHAYYTGSASFVPPEEEIDEMGNGFMLGL
ncbi:proline racemase, partial [Lentinula boryana]